MSPHSLACPQCHAALRSSKPFPAAKQVRCPQCGAHFVAGSVPTASAGRSRTMPIIFACAAGLILGAAAIGGVALALRKDPSPPVAKEEPKTHVDEESRKQLDAEREKTRQLEERLRAVEDQKKQDEKRKEFAGLMQKGK